MYNKLMFEKIEKLLLNKYNSEKIIIDFIDNINKTPANIYKDKLLKNINSKKILSINKDDEFIFIYKNLKIFCFIKQKSIDTATIKKYYFHIEIFLNRKFISYLNNKLNDNKSTLEKKEAKIDELKKKLKKSNSSIDEIKNEKNIINNKLKKYQKLLQKLKRKNKKNEKLIDEKDAQIKKVRGILEKISGDLSKKKKENEKLNKTIKDKNDKINKKDQEIESLKKQLKKRDKIIKIIEKAKKKLMKIFDNLTDPLQTLHTNYNLESINNSAAELMDKKPVDIINDNKKCFEVLGKDSPCEFCFLDTVIEDREPVKKTIDVDINDKKKYFVLTMLPVFNDKDEIEVIIEYFRDITKSVNVMEEKNEIETELKDAIDEKERMKMTVDWSDVNKVKDLAGVISNLRKKMQKKESKIKRQQVLIDNLKKQKSKNKEKTNYLYDIQKMINYLKNLKDGKKIVLNNLQDKNLEEAISLIKDYSVYMQKDYEKMEKENKKLRNQIEEYEQLIEDKEQEVDKYKEEENNNSDKSDKKINKNEKTNEKDKNTDIKKKN